MSKIKLLTIESTDRVLQESTEIKLPLHAFNFFFPNQGRQQEKVLKRVIKRGKKGIKIDPVTRSSGN